jgi:hypothetical protein
MSVHWQSMGFIPPMADYRSFRQWQETARYAQLLCEQNDRLQSTQKKEAVCCTK